MNRARVPGGLVGVVCLAIVAGAGCTRVKRVNTPPTLKTTDGVAYQAHEVIVRRTPGASTEDLMKALGRVGGKVADAGGPLGELGYVRVVLPSSTDADAAILRLQEEGAVAKAERNYLVEHCATPNDPRLGELWGLTKIGAPRAWDVTTGSQEVIVAVSDSGVDYRHPDLAANMWKNPGEIPGNGKDDDGNGWVDDIYGFDFANNDGDPMDDNGHGSHVAGTIGAVGNDGVGVAGVNWRVRIQATKFLGASGSGSLYSGAQTILYAAKNKARVVNASWGCAGPSCYASYMEDALKTLAAAGGLFVAAAGNATNDNDAYPFYPANYGNPNVISVAATGTTDTLAYFSNWGATKVHLAAPGVGILSTTPNNGYSSFNGTSMAAPHVAGAAALYLAKNPSITYGELKAKILGNVDPVGALGGKVSTGGRLSVSRIMTSDGEPPPVPQDVQAVPGTRNDITLSWAPVKVDDLAGYRVRFGTAAGNRPERRDLGKDVTSLRLTGLAHGTTYYFTVEATDTSANVSALSPEVNAAAVDGTAPPQVVDLTAAATPGRPASGMITAASGDNGVEWAAARAADGNHETAWMAPPRAAPVEEHIVLGLTTSFFIDRIELHPSAAYPEFFPVDFDVQLSSDGISWTTVGGMRNAAATRGEPINVLFPPAWANAVRINVSRTHQHESGLHYTAIGELTAREVSKTPDGVQVRFTAPGDDPGEGKATKYDLRIATAPLDDASFPAAKPVATGAPSAAGIVETVAVGALGGETKYYLALRAHDEAGNISPLSNVAVTTTSVIPPATIVDLRQTGGGSDWVSLAWTAPGNDGKEGTAARYELRHSTAPIDAGNFASATLVPLPAPQTAGSAESASVPNLSADKLYHFAIRAFDATGTPGGLSNVVVTRPEGGPDTTPPAAVGELIAFRSFRDRKLAARVDTSSASLSGYGPELALDGKTETFWVGEAASRATPAWLILDLGAVETVSRVRLHAGLRGLAGFHPEDFTIAASADKANWTTLAEVRGFLPRQGQWSEWGMTPTPTRYLRLYVTKRGPTGEDPAIYVDLAELEVYALTPELEVDLTWVAPGDDGYVGTASRYDLRRSDQPITNGNFAAATTVLTLAPLPGGSIELLHLPGMPMETTHHYGIKAIDDAGNVGALSNIARIDTPAVPPGPVGDLVATAPKRDGLTLTFTAAGDDGTVGRATAYDLRRSNEPITSETFGSATVVPTSPPAVAGTRESVTVGGLAPNTVYYFALQVIDDRGARSLLSNVARGETLDGTAPSRVADLVATPVDPSSSSTVPLAVVGSSGAFSNDATAANLLDGDPATGWLTAARTEPSEEEVLIDLGGARWLGRLRMRAAIGYEDLFPGTFRLDVRPAVGASWVTVVSETDFVTKGQDEDWMLGAVAAVEARLIVHTKPWAGSHYAAIGDLALFENSTDTTRVRLAWTAPGDDGNVGTAARYDLRRAPTAIDEASFAGAGSVPGVPGPRVAGSLERFEVAGLAPDTRVCFALKAVDDAEQAGDASNSPCVTTPGLPPGTIIDLQITKATANAMSLAWTATGADGNTGQAAAYELRWSSARITDANWAEATPVSGLPAPALSGAAEAFTVAGLAPMTTYHFAIRAVDAAGNMGGVSNGASGKTLDGTAPSAVRDLVATAVDPSETPALTPTVAESSGSFSSQTAPANLLDGNPATAWLTPARTIPTIDGVRFALGSARRLGRVRMRAATGYQDLFPSEFRIEVLSAPGASWIPVVSEQNFVTTGAAEDWSLGGVTAIEVRLLITKHKPWAGAQYAALGDLHFFEDGTDGTRVRLAWTAPGDDGSVGTATSYDLRRAATAIDEAAFPTATTVANAPAPRVAGSLERFDVTGLSPETTYCFALKAVDDVGLTGGGSNSPCVTTPGLPPGTILDLKVTKTTAKTVTLTWTASGADGNTGRASAYELRWSNARISEANWASATAITGLAPPATSGAAETFTVSGLQGLTTYYFALRAVDAGGNRGALSNAASGRTLDDVPPSTVADLTIATDTTKAGTVIVSWTAPGDNGPLGKADRYDFRFSTDAITEANFANAIQLPLPAPQTGGTTERLTIQNLPPESRIFVALKTYDAAANVSGLSRVVEGRTRDEAPSAVTTLTVVGGRGDGQGSLVVQWVAPGDDGTLGTATSYEIRYATTAITAATFPAATLAASVPAPAPSGQWQQHVLGGLAVGQKYWIALVAIDDRGNRSALSNVVTGDTPDEVAPGRVTDLAAKPGTARGKVDITFTAPGDDGTVGTAKTYELRWATTPIDEGSFTIAKTVTPPAPAVAGAKQTFTIAGLPDESTVYLALRARDDANNAGPVSNGAESRTPDVAPAAVTTLKQTARTAGSITVSWTAPGDDDNIGTAAAYDLRWSSTPITAANFDAATSVPTSPPLGAGATETSVVGGLQGTATYHVALKTRDDRGNWSPLSNVVSAETSDQKAPGRVADLLAKTGTAAGTVILTWTAPGDDAATGTAATYELRRSTAPIDASNFAAATPVPGPAAPKSAGAAESYTVAALDGEKTFHFALRAVDEAGNTGEVSNAASASTPPVPPAPVTNLAATASNGAVTLTWTAPGDDGTTGTAVAYDVRYATTAITGASFQTAIVATGVPAPMLAGATQSFTISGLAESTTYHFALRTRDDVDAWSPLSNVPKATTPDVTRPAAPGGLSVTTPGSGGEPLDGVSAESSSSLGAGWKASAAIDHDETTSWASAATVGTETLTIDLGTTQSIDRVRLLPDPFYPQLFPRDFSIEISADKKAWNTVVVEDEFATSSASPVTWGFRAADARYVRVTATATNASYDRRYAIIAEVEALAAAATDGRALLTWIAPGDDGSKGTATSYKVYRHTAAFTEATLPAEVPSPPKPLAAGALQTMSVTGLAGETTYHWAVRALDEAGNLGPLSPVVAAKTNGVAPAPVADLAAAALGTTSVRLTWSAPGDDGATGKATKYELRRATFPITAQSFPLATAVEGVPAPAVAGAAESFVVTGLEAGKVYRFALVARDEADNASYLSNVAVVATQRAADVTPPAAITDLAARQPPPSAGPLAAKVTGQSSEQAPGFPASAAADGRKDTSWSSAARSASEAEFVRLDLGAITSIDRARLWPASGQAALFPSAFEVRVSLDGLAWTTVATVVDHHATAGVPFQATFTATNARFLELRATALAPADNGLFYAVVSEIEVLETGVAPGTVLLSFTAPSDDGPSERAASYDLRVGRCPLAGGTPVATTTPLPAGSPERFTATGLAAGTWCATVTSRDEAGNVSAPSNPLSFTVQ